MSERAAQTTLFSLGLDRASQICLERQLYAQLRDAILCGRVAPGIRIPSTRNLAADLECSRNTVVSAIGMLLAEGYLVGKRGSGTFVSRILPEELLTVRAKIARAAASGQPVHSELSRRGEAMAAISLPRPLKDRPFDIGVPEVGFFPFQLWARLLAQCWRHPQQDLLSYGAPGGHLGLREQIVNYLRQSRGVQCEPDQVFITCGAQQAFDFLARLLIDPGDGVWVEDPGYFGSRGALAAAGARIVPVEVDDEGMIIGAGAVEGTQIRAVVVTPSHQFPLGVVMSLSRRLQLLDWAERNNAWIVEDDYDSEFRYSGPPVTSLQGLSAGPTHGAGRVIYVGSFSKVLFPGLRLGYLIAPRQIAEKFARARRLLDSQYSSTVQPVLAEFLQQGHFSTHIRRLRRVYQARQQVLLACAKTHLGDLLELLPHDAGLHLVADFKPQLRSRMDDMEAARRAASQGVFPRPLSAYCLKQSKRDSLLLGYAGMNEEAIEQGVRRLAQALS